VILHPVSIAKPFEIADVPGLGDAPVNQVDKDISTGQIQAFFEELYVKNTTPIAIGRDHTEPPPVVCAADSGRDPTFARPGTNQPQVSQMDVDQDQVMSLTCDVTALQTRIFRLTHWRTGPSLLIGRLFTRYYIYY
jgi:hypothetical protein